MGTSDKAKKKAGKNKPANSTENHKRRKVLPSNVVPEDFCVPADNLDLYDSLNNDNSTPKVAAKDWIKLYSDDEESALYQILALITKVSGCTLVISKDALNEGTNFEEVVKELEKTTEIDEVYEDLFASRTKVLKDKKKKVLEFFKQVLNLGLDDLFSEFASIKSLIEWLGAFSNSDFRPLRHAATLISLSINTFLCEICLDLEGGKSAALQQEANQNKKKPKKGAISNASKSKEISLQIKNIETTMGSIFSSVFVKRYRDSDPNIRVETIQELANWILKYPSYFMKDEFLDYIGIQLSDKSTAVRTKALQAVLEVLNSKLPSSKLRLFMKSYKPRLLELGQKEVDVNVQCQANSVLLQVYNHGFLSEEDKETLTVLAFHQDPKVRSSIAPYISALIETDLIPNLIKNDYDADPSTLSEQDKTRLSFKGLYSVLNKKYGEFIQTKPDADLLSYTNGFTMAFLKEDQDNDPTSQAIASLLPELEFAKDLELLLGIVGQNPSKQKKKAAKLSEDSEMVFLVKVLEVGFKILAAQNENFDKSEASKKTGEVSSFKQLQGHLVQEIKPLRLLVNYFMADDFVVIPILRIVRFALNGELFLEANKLKPYVDLIKSVQSLFLTRSNPNILFEAVKTLKALGSFTSVPQDINDCNNSFVQDIINKLTSSKGNQENEEAYLQKLRAVLMQVPWNYEAVYKQSTSQVSKYLYENTGARIQVMDNIKVTIASLDILYRCFLWRSYSLPVLENEAEVPAESIKDLLSLRNHLIDSCLFIMDVHDVTEESFEVQRHAYVLLNDLCWLLKYHTVLKEHPTVPSIYNIGKKSADFIKRVITKWEKLRIEEINEFNESNILANSSLRHNFVEIFISQVRSVQSRVFHPEAATNIISYYGNLDPVVNESIKLTLSDGLKFKLRNARDAETIGKSLQFLSDALFESFNRSINSPVFYPLDKVVNFAKLYANTIRHIGTNNGSISEAMAQTHQDFTTKAISIYKANLENQTQTELSPLIIFRILGLLTKRILSPLNAQELLRRVKIIVNEVKPEEENIEWQLYSNYVATLTETFNVLNSAQRIAHIPAVETAELPPRTIPEANEPDLEQQVDLGNQSFTFTHF